MARDLTYLAKKLRKLPDLIEQGANKIAIDVVKAIDRDLVPHTPVDETTAVSNWQAELNRKPNFELPAIAPGFKGSTAGISRPEAIAHVDRSVSVKKPGEPAYLSNLKDYIVDLNNGSSAQEPKGFVERAVLVGRLTVRKAKLLGTK